MTKRLDATYDPEADAAYFSLSPRIGPGKAAKQRVVGIPENGELILDFDKRGRLLGLEILGAKNLLKRKTMKTLRRLN
ncbi:MAG: hypothetical protein JWP75_436 [Frondihabitans sp.]|nr:hypothetical protein [Frondihabitans sp.]